MIVRPFWDCVVGESRLTAAFSPLAFRDVMGATRRDELSVYPYIK
jgi:hypothetical protein